MENRQRKREMKIALVKFHLVELEGKITYNKNV